MTKRMNLPRNGDGGNKTIKAESDTITFETSGNCNSTSFSFTGGTAIPPAGYPFDYTTDGSPKRGNGTGTTRHD